MRVIFHLDMDAFYASIEQRDNPPLRGKPVIVGSPPNQRGVVCAASYEARKFGVRSAMPSSTASRLCPKGVFVPPRMSHYREESRIIMELVARTGAVMGRRTFDVVDVTELFVHWEAGRSQVQISVSLGLDRKTVRKFLAPALAEGLVPGGPPAGELVWAQRIAGWFPGLSDARLRQVTWPAIEAHRDYIVKQLADEVTVSTISARVCSDHPAAFGSFTPPP
jgi:hypothetical protein